MAKTVQDVLALIKEEGIKMVDFKMVDINGQYRHVTIPADNFSETVMQLLRRATWYLYPTPTQLLSILSAIFPPCL